MDPVTGELASVIQTGVLVIATDPAYPPQSQLAANTPRSQNTRCDMTSYTANQLSGFDVDVARNSASRLRVEPCFVTPTWSQIISGNWNGRWDINVGSMVITPTRLQALYFTQPYISGEAVLFIHKDNQTFKTPVDLSGKKIGVCVGCAYEDYLKQKLSIPGVRIDYLIQNAVIVGYDTDTSALMDLSLGDGIRLDAVMTDPDTGNSAIRKGYPIKRMQGAIYQDYSAVALDKNSPQDPLALAEKITQIVQQMHADGTLLALSQKYYGGDFTTPAAKFDIQALKQFP
jgi:polar amino acid transport system substrate-binding protein